MHVNPALGGGLSGTLGNARVVPDVADLAIAQAVFRPRVAPAVASAASGLGYYLQPISDGDLVSPSIVFAGGDIVTAKLAVTAT